MNYESRNKAPKFKKLAVGGDYYTWSTQIQLHYETLGLWDLVSQAPEQEVENDEEINPVVPLDQGEDQGDNENEVEGDGDDDPVDVEDPVVGENRLNRRIARCKRDMLAALEDELVLTVRHMSTAYEMLKRIRTMFVGTVTSQRMKLRTSINLLYFQKNYFDFMTNYQTAVSQLRSIGGVFSEKDLTMQFLSKLPRTIGSITHPLKQHVENAVEDNNEVWEYCYDKVLVYLIDCGFYDASKKYVAPEEEKKKVQVAVTDKFDRSNLKCYGCGEMGHFKSDCPKRSENKNRSKTPESWMVRQVPVANAASRTVSETFILDSGASYHVCGNSSLFTDLKKIKKEELITANGNISYEHSGSVSIQLDNGLDIVLSEVLFWTGAPNLISIGTLTEKGLNTVFLKNKAEIRRNNRTLYSAAFEDGFFLVKYKKKKKAMMLSLKVWHSRFNHCGEKKLLKTLGDKVSKKQIEDFSKETCIGCMQGKTHRNPIITKNKIKKDYEALELLVADTVGPYDRSIDRKRGALVVGCAGSNFLWFLPYFSKSEVAGLFIALLRRLELAYPGKVKRVRTDNGTEFINKTLRGFLQTTGVEHERTIPYEHEMNGRAENNNRILLEGIRSVLQQSKLSRYWWSYAGKAVAYSYNLQKPSAGGLSPWKYVRNSVEPLERLRVFGVIGFAHISRDIRRKLDATAVKARFLGYSEDSVGYIVQRLDTKRIFYSRSFYCNEDLFVTVPVSDRLLAATGEYITVDNMQSLLQRDAEEEEDIDTFLQPTEEEDPNLPYDNVDETAEAIPTTVPTQPEIVIEEPVQEGTVEDITEEIVVGPVEDTTDVGVDIQGLKVELNFTDISTENIIQGARTRSQAQVATTKPEENEQQKALVLRKIRRAVLKLKLDYDLKTKRDMKAKGFRSYKEALKQDSSWEDAYVKEIKKLESLGNMEVVDRTPDKRCINFVEVFTEKTDNISGEVTLIFNHYQNIFLK